MTFSVGDRVRYYISTINEHTIYGTVKDVTGTFKPYTVVWDMPDGKPFTSYYSASQLIRVEDETKEITMKVGDKVRYLCGTSEPSGTIGTVTAIEYGERPILVEWTEDGYTAHYRADQLTTNVTTPPPTPFHYNEQGSFDALPTLDECAEGMTGVIANMKEREGWLENLRHLCASAPKGVSGSDLLALSNAIETLEKRHRESEESFRRRTRLAIGVFVRGEQ